MVKFFCCQFVDPDHSWAILVSSMRIISKLWFSIIFFFYSLAESTGNVRLQFGRKEGSGLVTIKKFIIKIKVGKGNIKLHNLFNGDKVLGNLLQNKC